MLECLKENNRQATHLGSPTGCSSGVTFASVEEQDEVTARISHHDHALSLQQNGGPSQ